MQRTLLSGLAVLMMGTLTACGGSQMSDEETPAAKVRPEGIPVRVAVYGSNLSRYACEDEAFRGIGTGKEVAVYDAERNVVAMASLSQSAMGKEGGDTICGWEAKLSVPPGGKFYYATIREWSSDPQPEEGLTDLLINLND